MNRFLDESWSATAGRAAYWAAMVVLFLSAPRLPKALARNDLDPSWGLALHHAFDRQWQVGVDYIFTTGPLGFLLLPVYYQPHFLATVVFAVGVALALCLVAARLTSGLKSRFAAAAILFGLSYAFTGPLDCDCYFLLLGTTSLLLAADRPSISNMILAASVMAIFAHIKLTFLILGALLGLLSGLQILKRRGLRDALLFAGGLLALYLGIAKGAGQSFSNLPVYLRKAWEISSGYDAAMKPPGPIRVETAVALALAVLAACAVWQRIRRRERSWAVLVAAAWASVLFIVFKHGFARQSDGHALIAFSFLAISPAILLPYAALPYAALPYTAEGRKSRMQTLVPLLIVAIGAFECAHLRRQSIAASAVDPPARAFRTGQTLVDLRGYASRLERDATEQAARDALPNVVARVGDQTVDLLGFRQGVLLSNRLNWRPRPIFQSYSAYTPGLAACNRDHFLGDAAPRFVLLKWETIDDRLPTLDDGPAWLAIGQNYKPALYEGGFLLMERREPSPGPIPSELLDERIVRFGEVVDFGPIGRDQRLLQVLVRRSLLGRARKFLLNAASLTIRVVFDDATESQYAFIAAMAEEPILIDPLPISQAEMVRYFDNKLTRRVRSIRIDCDPRDRAFFEEPIQVKIYRYSRS